MPRNTNREFLRRQEEQRQRNIRLAAEAQADRVRRQAGNQNITTDQALEWDGGFEQQMLYGDSIMHGIHTGAMDPTDRSTPVNGGRGFTITTGARGQAEINRAIQEQVDRTSSYDLASTVARFGHLLSDADQQRLGYVAPAAAPVDGHEVHTLSYPRVRLRDALPTPPAEMSRILAYAFGTGPRAASGNVLSMLTGGTDAITRDQESNSRYSYYDKTEVFPSAKLQSALQDLSDQQAAKDQADAAAWLKTSPWG